MKRFLSRLAPWRSSKRFCAVDFDSRQVRIVHATQAGAAARLLKLATAQVPPGLDVENAEAVGEFLGRTLDQMGLRGAWVLMNVPRSKAVLKPLTLPPVAHPGELAGMVLYQAEKELTFRPEDTVVDFTSERHYGVEPAGSDEPQGEHVLAAAVRRGVVEHYQRIAKAAGARLLRLGLRPYANMRCLEAYGGQEPGARLALVHLTADETEIDILSGNSLTFSRAAIVEVPFGGEGAEAELQEAVQVIVTEVARSLQSYMTVDRDHRIDSVLLAGGTGIESRVAAELDKRLAVQCQTFDPSQALGLEEPGAGASGFISALGLAVGQAGRAEPPFDFLNPKRPVVRRDLTRIAVLGGWRRGCWRWWAPSPSPPSTSTAPRPRFAASRSSSTR